MEYSPIKDNRNGAEGENDATSDADDPGVVGRMKNAFGVVAGKVQQTFPDVSNVYVQPLSPSADISLADRWRLMMESTRPWGEFFDITNYNLPPWGQIKTRYSHNIETYFYNYIWLACLHVLIFTFFHFGSVFSLVIWLAAMYVLYGVYSDDIQVAGFTINKNVKFGIMIITAIIALTFGHVFTLVFSIAIFLLILVGIHGLVRDDASDFEDTI